MERVNGPGRVSGKAVAMALRLTGDGNQSCGREIGRMSARKKCMREVECQSNKSKRDNEEGRNDDGGEVDDDEENAKDDVLN